MNPLREVGLVRFQVPSDARSMLRATRIADQYVQPHIGGDLALLTGIAKSIRERDAVDHAFLAAATDDSEAFLAAVESASWEDIVERSGVPRPEIEAAAALYAASKRTVFAWAMGITHHVHGVENVQMIANLALLRGMVGRPGAGLLPIRGHSNVQGIGSMGVTPALKAAFLTRLEEHFGIALPREPGLDTLACLERAAAGGMRFGLCLGGNIFGATPDADFARRAMGNIDMVVHLSTTLNTGHVGGRGRETLVLPVRARDEEAESTTQESMFNFVRLSDGGPARLEGPRGEAQVIAALGAAVLGEADPLDWKALARHGRVREAIAAVVPGYAALAEVDRTRREFQIEGRTFHTPRFATANGRAKFHAVSLPEDASPRGSLRLMTVRSEGQFNTVVYEEEDVYRGQERRDVILLHAADIARLGLHVDQRVTVRSEVGALHGILVRAIDVRPGNAVMYFPEANVLVPTRSDPRARTPAFKNVPVTLEPGPRPGKPANRGGTGAPLPG